MYIKSFVRDCLPPIILRFIQRLRNPENIKFEGHYSSWGEASARCIGYDEKSILDKVLTATREVRLGRAIFERDSVLFDHIEYSWPLLAGLLWAASLHGGGLRVLDFGGALGSTFFQNRRFVNALSFVDWGVVEQEAFVRAGNEFIADERLSFFCTIEACVTRIRPNVAILSSVLPYLEDPWIVLNELLSKNIDILIVDRTPFVNQSASERIAIQSVPSSIYVASYPCRHFFEIQFREYIERAGYDLIESFLALDHIDDSVDYKGFIYKRREQ